MTARCKRTEEAGMMFYCPGCDHAHRIRVEGDGAWGWNGSVEMPTFTPSVLVTGPMPRFSSTMGTCHSFVTDGRIQYLTDSTHGLAGQTVDLPDWPPPPRAHAASTRGDWNERDPIRLPKAGEL